MTDTHDIQGMERPWWSVRGGLLTALIILATILTLIYSKPEIVESGLLIAGL